VWIVLERLRGNLKRQPRLAGATRPGQRDDAVTAEELPDLPQLALSTEERRGLSREIGRVERLERRKLLRSELVELLGLGQVLEPV
jgi:hypothetical protein